MKPCVFAIAFLAVAATAYATAYIVSAQKFEYWIGSSPIDDPTWSIKTDIEPHYRFLPSQFWKIAHSVDKKIRPDYWTFIVTASSSSNSNLVTEPISKTK